MESGTIGSWQSFTTVLKICFTSMGCLTGQESSNNLNKISVRQYIESYKKIRTNWLGKNNKNNGFQSLD